MCINANIPPRRKLNNGADFSDFFPHSIKIFKQFDVHSKGKFKRKSCVKCSLRSFPKHNLVSLLKTFPHDHKSSHLTFEQHTKSCPQNTTEHEIYVLENLEGERKKSNTLDDKSTFKQNASALERQNDNETFCVHSLA
jgi:hypothetical protein